MLPLQCAEVLPSFLSSIHPSLSSNPTSSSSPTSHVLQAPDAHTIPNTLNLGIQRSLLQEAGTGAEADMPVLKHGIYTTAALDALCFMNLHNS
jgi:hypothetical protein